MTVLQNSVQYLKGVGEKRAALLSKLGLLTVEDLLAYFPRSYEDFSAPLPVAGAVRGEVCCVRATVSSPVTESIIRPGMVLYKLSASDETGMLALTFFNNRYIKDLLREGQTYLFYGKVGGNLFAEMASPEFIKPEDAGLLPVYPLTQGVTNRMMRDAVRHALELFPENLSDPLPAAMRQRCGLCHKRFALWNIHFPQSVQDLETARRRLAFEELLCLQLGMLSIRNRNRRSTAAVCRLPQDFSAFYTALPFEPTAAQKKAVAEAAADMARAVPMNRLLQGDVGSGKTAVAAALCWFAAKNGLQSAVMAPTEILAQQHARSFSELLGESVRVGLLTGGVPTAEKKRILEGLADGAIQVVAGTHALLQEGVEFRNLGLVVTDEQHRFGVAQRAALTDKGMNPHMLVMSATPIPRTLSLLLYGDLDVSQLDEMPRGRQKVETYAVDSSKRPRIYRFIRGFLDKGLQAFIVCPLIEEGESELAAAESYAKKLQNGEFKGYRVGLLHGKQRPARKEAVMRDFADGKYQLLVSTTVVEVGVDVPRAVVMVVENAERFGLSQLHQLRGRVGRGRDKAYCILISDAQNNTAVDRLKILCSSNDGFEIAQKDLELRGPGDFFGSRQHGLPELRVADLFSDMALLRLAQKEAETVLKNDPSFAGPQNAGLRGMVSRLFSTREDVIFN